MAVLRIPMVVNSNCYRTLTSNMATYIVKAVFILSSVHSICFFVESKNLDSIHVPHNVPEGRIIKRIDGWGHNSRFHCMDSDAKGLFSLLENGNLVRSNRGNLTHLIGKTVSFIAKHPDTQLQDVLHIKILQEKISLYFPKHRYSGTVRENEPPNTQILLDRDLYAVSDDNHPISYSIYSTDLDRFSLAHMHFNDKDIVLVKTNVPLDREEKDEYDIVVQAEFNTEVAECIVHITVLDKNDNPPVFHQRLYSAVYSEPIPGRSKLWTLHATDPDLGLIHYAVLDDTYFSIDSETGEVYTKSTGYMQPGEYTSMAVALDEAGHTSDPVSLVLNIGDTLKSAQHFLHRSRRDVEVLPTRYITVPENGEETNQPLFSVASQPPVPNEEYKIVYSSVNLFQVDRNGNVYLINSGALDYENPDHQLIFLQFNITNGQDIQLKNVTLTVTDVNDESPVFKNIPVPFLATVSTNANAREDVFTLLAEDPDTNSSIKYFLQGGGGKFLVETEVDQSTGKKVGRVKTAVSGSQQFPEGEKYTMRVSAEDENAPAGTKQSTPVELLEVVVGFREPQFYENPYRAQVIENNQDGFRLLTEEDKILVVKAESFQNKPISYTLYNEFNQSSSLFQITPEGEVETKLSLDFENPQTPHQYTLNLVATEEDTDLTSTGQMIVNLIDANDEDPIFQQSTYIKNSVKENTEVGTLLMTVSATDRDSGSNAQLNYSVTDEHFSVETQRVMGENGYEYKGYVRLAKPIDYDYQQDHKYTFDVIATDHGESPRKGTALMIISVANVNDEKPVFNYDIDHLYASVREDQEPPSVVTTVAAVDPDGDNVRFFFEGGREVSGPFKIYPPSGLIVLNKKLSSTIPRYELNITAVDDGTCCSPPSSLSSSTVIVIEVTDVNYDRPQFVECASYKPTVDENRPAGTHVITVTAVDNDRGQNGQVTYSVMHSNQANSLPTFQVNSSTGEVTTLRPFDREDELAKRGYLLTVKAEDHGEPQKLQGFCFMRVTVNDENDNPPVFDANSYSANIGRDEAPNNRISSVRALDPDLGKNGSVRYSLIENPGDYFRIGQESGIVYLDKALTSSQETQLTLRIKAEDEGDTPQSNEVTLTVNLGPSQVPAPEWARDDYENTVYRVEETALPGTQIANFTANSNSEETGVITFDFVTAKGSTLIQDGIRLSRVGNMAILKVDGGLDYNTKKDIELRLRVTNPTNPEMPLSSEIRIHIELIDTNNMIPVFEGIGFDYNTYRASVPENQNPKEDVLTVTAIDPDHNPPNNLLTYKLDEAQGDSNLFSIDPVSGLIKTEATFDREDKNTYRLTVIVLDGAPSTKPGSDETKPNSASAQVAITISDRNDNPPKFPNSSYTVAVQETSPIQSSIIQISATDVDSDDQLEYSILNGESSQYKFGIRLRTGDIYVAKPLDYETPPTEYTLQIMVHDGIYNDTAVVKITILDENDNPPEFGSTTYEIDSVVEETEPPPGGQFLVKTTATDKDERPNDITYSLSGYGTGGPNPFFVIDPKSGDIRLMRALDRDLPEGQSEFTFTVMALDEPGPSELPGYSSVTVRPKDINDNKPRFEDNIQGSVFENSQIGQSVMTVIAKDYDAGENGTVHYVIDPLGNNPSEPGGKHLFTIESETGLVKSNTDTLDRESVDRYLLSIVAADKGVEPQSSSATVTINIADMNDQKPVFVQKIYQVKMSENLKSGPVVTVSATDNDIGENAKLMYTLKTGEDAKFFKMEDIPPNAGVLNVFTPVDYENPDQRKFNLTVTVSDSNEDHTDEAYIEINVEDYNDNAPLFDHPAGHSMTEDENVVPGTVLHQFTASDKDSGINAEFEYKIDRSTDPGRRFSVGSDDGIVKVRMGLDGATLDRETDSEHNVRILAIDRGDPPMTGSTTLSLTVNDINDNAPEFLKDYRPVVMENTEPTKLVITFKAKDRDTAKFGAPFFFTLPPCTENPTCNKFDMEFEERPDGNVGIVTSLRQFDREEVKYYYLPVIMSDMYEKNSVNPLSQTATRLLMIEIGDENDNPHSNGHKDITVYNYRGQFGDIVIGTVYAEDKDDMDVGDKNYYFVGPKEMASYFSVDLDNGDITMAKNVPPGIHNFNAKVYDRVVFKKNATASVTVIVEEISEEAVYNSGSIRIKGMTAEQFIEITKGANPTSTYSRFRELLADYLKVPIAQVLVFSVMNNGEYTDIRYAAHGSPYYSASKLDGIVSFYKDQFEKEIGVDIVMVNIDECMKEICESDGCSNILVVGDQPALVNTNATAFVGVSTKIEAECICKARDFSQKLECSATYCLNGGTCNMDDWGDISCECLDGFDGKRCQMTRHRFYGGFALFAPLAQCEDSVTTIEFLTGSSSGLILYNGPLENPQGLDPRDFISLELFNGYPRLRIDHGTGELQLSLNGKDSRGSTLVNQLANSKWHRIDIIRKGREVTMVIDNCQDVIQKAINNNVAMDFSACKVTGKTEGENLYLNVNSMLQLGGRFGDRKNYPPNLNIKNFEGCIRNLRHNGELYDLYTSPQSVGTGHANGCQQEDEVCGGAVRGGRCGENGLCEVISIPTRDYRCICDPGFRLDQSTNQCSLETYIRDLRQQSYVTWTLKDKFYNKVSSVSTWLQVMFRTRDNDGLLLHLPSNNQDYITLELDEGHVQVSYKLKNSESDENILKLGSAEASNGQWHTVEMRRIGQWFQLKMDSGEGRYYAESWGSPLGSQVFEVSMSKILLGARVVFGQKDPSEPKPVFDGRDLSETCINDVRMDNDWFPLNYARNEQSEAAQIDFERNLVDGCVRDDCDGASCPVGFPKSKVCYPLWGTYECRCEEGYEAEGLNCLPINYCVPNPCFNNAPCIQLEPPNGFRCRCPSGWKGDTCNQQQRTSVADAGLTVTGMVVIILSVFAVLIIALLIFMWYKCRPNKAPDKYFLDDEPDDDIRENVINYDEEGAGEEDQDGYDMSRLRKPGNLEPVTNPMYEPGIRTTQPLGKDPRGDRPDVGNFINERLDDTDDDNNAPPFDSVCEFGYEGGGSDAGSLSSLNTSTSSGGDQDYDYLNDWGPKFAKLADMYGAGQEEDS